MQPGHFFRLIAAILVIGALPLPYSYYSGLRLAVTLCFAYLLHLGIASRHWPAVFAAAPAVVLFNPLYPIQMDKGAWAAVDLSTAAYLVAVSRFAEARFSGLALRPSHFSFMSLAFGAFAGIFAATCLAFVLFLLAYPADWLGKPSPFRTFRYLFPAMIVSPAIYLVVRLMYEEADTRPHLPRPGGSTDMV